MRNKRGLAVFSLSAIAVLVSVAATWPRFHVRPVDPVAEHPSVKLPLVASAPEASGPLSWARLSADQHEALAPFAHDWDKFDDDRKRRWIKIASRYKKMSPDAQKRLHGRMHEWLSMTPEQRRTARENYQLSKQVPVQQRENAWNAYQRLPEDQKKTLAAAEKRNHRPTVVTAPPTGTPELKNLNHALHAETLAEELPAAASQPVPLAPPAPASVPASAPEPASTPLLTQPASTPWYFEDRHP
ncbi:DUF3106 domain-containing protein [Pararobbsia alpina]|uniref:Transmembrane protein n=1 Tax=Pararobbsia alpina TaxID=621374 RepID=A0A6S7BDT6_9BURK|nr:DUF3106 domain-containing protein [Pararobbsia alpina]CAB3785733.1 hypothetical protein LMG28138_02047 [Pararobbsia alpina]